MNGRPSAKLSSSHASRFAARARATSPTAGTWVMRVLKNSPVLRKKSATWRKSSSSMRRSHISTRARSRVSTPIKGGSGCVSSKYRQMATLSGRQVPSSSSRTGSSPKAFFCRNSGVWLALLGTSTCSTGMSIPFSARKMRTRRGLGARWKSYSFMSFVLSPIGSGAGRKHAAPEQVCEVKRSQTRLPGRATNAGGEFRSGRARRP